MRCIHGDLKEYWMKQVRLKLWVQVFVCRVVVVSELDCPVLLGRDCPILQQIVAVARATPVPSSEGLQTEILPLELPLGEGECPRDQTKPLLVPCLTSGTETRSSLGHWDSVPGAKWAGG